ncbi:hypothetical protein ACFFUE_02940 [Bergeyella porcorum]|uniref:hypothetical protein n=1 Tax=Bergeyella porcorum TaxID=1735111 RepID=UPI0035EF4EB8
MSISNLNNSHLSDEQIKAISDALAQLETAMQSLSINLTPEDRNKYGRVNEQNKLFVNKVYDFAKSREGLRSPDVDWAEFFKDYEDRNFYETVMSRLDDLQLKLKNHKILGDYDNYQDALADYAFATYKAGTKSVGFEEKYRELKQFFVKSNKKQAPNGENQASEGEK